MKEKFQKHLEENFKSKEHLGKLANHLETAAVAIGLTILPDSDQDVNVYAARKTAANLLAAIFFPTEKESIQDPSNDRMASFEAAIKKAAEMIKPEAEAWDKRREALIAMIDRIISRMEFAQSLKQPKNFLSGIATPEELKIQYDEARSRFQRIKDEKKATESGRFQDSSDVDVTGVDKVKLIDEIGKFLNHNFESMEEFENAASKFPLDASIRLPYAVKGLTVRRIIRNARQTFQYKILTSPDRKPFTFDKIEAMNLPSTKHITASRMGKYLDYPDLFEDDVKELEHVKNECKNHLKEISDEGRTSCDQTEAHSAITSLSEYLLKVSEILQKHIGYGNIPKMEASIIKYMVESAKDQEERNVLIKCLEETAIESKRIIGEFNTADGPTLNAVKKLAEMQNQTASILQKHIGNGNI